MPEEQQAGAKRCPKRWDATRSAYTCADGTGVQAPNRAFRRNGRGREDADGPDCEMVLAGGVVYEIDGKTKRPGVRPFVSKTEFDRSLSLLVRGAMGAKTFTCPVTVRGVRDGAFWKSEELRSVVLNEGLETLGGRGDGESNDFEGVFGFTRI